MADDKGILIASNIIPAMSDGAIQDHATHIAKYGKGGWREVATIQERDAITDARCDLGMSVYVTSEKKLYILSSLDTSTTPYTKTWSLFSAGGVVVIPTPSETELGNIVQYIGDTTEQYTQGYFYKCISDGQDPATYSWVRIDVQPQTTVIDAVDSSAQGHTTDALSANMGYELNQRINNIEGRGRYLTLWNCKDGVAESDPPESPYTYKTGDYFIVGTVAASGGTNYRPDGTSYTTGVASTTIETEEVSVDDTYIFDGTTWHLQYNSQKTVTFAGIAGDPYDNINLEAALDNKVTTTDGSNKIYGTNSQGEQVTYDLTAFGQIDNVAIHGVNQPIDNKTVDLSVVEQVEALPTASKALKGRVVQYTGPDNNVSGLKHNYFYECVAIYEDKLVTTHASSPQTDFYIDVEAFLANNKLQTNTQYSMHKEGGYWVDDNDTRIAFSTGTVIKNHGAIENQSDTVILELGETFEWHISEVSGGGQYLALWNALIGEPATQLQYDHYKYKAGDYFVVSVAAEPDPESITATQTDGQEISFTFDSAVYKQNVKPLDDRKDILAYSNIKIQTDDRFLDGAVVIEDYDLFNQRYQECVDEGTRTTQSPITEVIGMEIRLFKAFTSSWYCACSLEAKTIQHPDGIGISCMDMTITGDSDDYTEETWKEVVIARLHDYFGIRIEGNFRIPNLSEGESDILHTNMNWSTKWTINNKDITESEGIRYYGITTTGSYSIGTVIEIEYVAPKITDTNYKPNGLEYIEDVASTTVETEALDVDDTYIFDGAIWRLQRNSKKDVAFKNIAGDPYDNRELHKALDEKITNKAKAETSVSILGTGASAVNAVNIGANTEAANYATALGYGANARSQGAVQIGEGSNYEQDTLQFRDWQLVDSEGKIPYERIPASTLFPAEELEDLNNYTDEEVLKKAAIYVGPTNDLYIHDYIYCGNVELARPTVYCDYCEHDYIDDESYITINKETFFQKIADISQIRIDKQEGDDAGIMNSFVGGYDPDCYFRFRYNVDNQEWYFEQDNSSLESTFRNYPEPYRLENGETLADFGIDIDPTHLHLPTEEGWDDVIFVVLYQAPVHCTGYDYGSENFTVNYMKFMTAMVNNPNGFGYIVNNLGHWDYQVGMHTYSMPKLPTSYVWNDNEWSEIAIRFNWNYDNEYWELYYNYMWDEDPIPAPIATFSTAELESIFGIVLDDEYAGGDIDHIGWTFESSRVCSWKQTNVQPQTDLVWGNITGTLSEQTDLQNALDAKQDTLTAGTNITIEEDSQTGELVISSKAQETFFRGRWDSWNAVPTDASLYPIDIHGNHKPLVNDFLVVTDASGYRGDYDNLMSITIQNTGDDAAYPGFSYTFIENGSTIKTVGYPSRSSSEVSAVVKEGMYITLNRAGYLQCRVNFYSDAEHTQPLQVKYNNNLVSSITSTNISTSVTEQIYYANLKPLEGSWRFYYDSNYSWDTDGKLGWKPQYQVEETLPDATDQEKGIAKLYNTTGQNTDGTMTQKAISDAIDNINESYFRGKWSNWTSVPTDTSRYPEDYNHNRIPTENDYMVVSDASDYTAEGMEIKIYWDGWGTHKFSVNDSALVALNGVSTWYPFNLENDVIIYIKDFEPSYGHFGIKCNVDMLVDGSVVPAGNIVPFVESAAPRTVYYHVAGGATLAGTWRFAYHGVWSSIGKNGWLPEYQLEDVLPIATDTEPGITKLYTTTGNNTDGTITQKAITDALGTKQNTLTAGNNITIDANSKIDAADKTLVSFVIWEDEE